MSFPDGLSSLAALVAAKTTLLLVLAYASSFLARKSSASARHALWALTFVFLLLVPGMAFVSSLREGIRIPIAVASYEPGIDPGIPAPSVAAPAMRVTDTPGYELRVAETSSASIPWASLVGSLWALGSSLLVFRLGLGLVTSRRVRAECEAIREPGWTDLLDEARDRLGVRREVDLRRSGRVRLPMTLGLFRPAILLPRSAEDYSISRRSAVILHELAHVRRRDCATQIVGQLVAAALWWNPLVWIACRQMRLLSERASDDLVLDAGARPSDYAHDLLELARGLNRGWASPLGSVTMAHRSRFEERLLAILDPRLARKAVSTRFVLASGIGASPLVLSLALAVPTASTREMSAQAQPAAPAREAEEPAEPAEQREPEVGREPRESMEPRAEERNEAREIAKAALGAALDDPEASVREQALEALVQLRDDSVAPYLEKALLDADPSTRAQAAWGLGVLRREDSAGALVGALRDADEEVRSQAAWALGMIRRREAVEGLVSALSDASPEVREQAAWALGMIRDSSAVEALSRALKDEDADVREQAAWALGLILMDEDEHENEHEDETPPPEPSVETPRPEPGSARLGMGAIL